MNMQTYHPIFTSGQVLTSTHLNSLLTWLEQQDRATRNKLIGIGIVCGLEVSRDFDAKTISISKGCALTSEGHFIIEDSSVLTQFRPYELPVSDDVDASNHLETPSSNYPFFIDNGQQISLWELLTEDAELTAGDAAPTALTNVFMDNKVVLLFLECTLESLKNCDLNDCSDKGARLNFTVRKLLVSRTDADLILQQEATISDRPVDRHNHPKYDLQPIHLEKINLYANGVTSFSELSQRIMAIADNDLPSIEAALEDGYSAYSYLLSDMFPNNEFPNGPFDSTNYFFNISANVNSNPLAIQHYYDVLYDLVQSYNEFIALACRLEAECCPVEGRFPKHILLGEPAAKPAATLPVDDGSFNPGNVNFDLGVLGKPQAYRHHFIYSMLFDGQHQMLKQVQSMLLRTWLLAYRYQTDGVLTEDLKITPSRGGDYDLSNKSLPYYYDFTAGDDLHRNWSFANTLKNQLAQVYSHQFIDELNHPLANRMEQHNFFRTEGLLGKSLGQVMGTLLTQKRQLGLNFAIDPIYMHLNAATDTKSEAFNQRLLDQSREIFLQLYRCKLRDIDAIFGVLIAALFYLLLVLLGRLYSASTTLLGTMNITTEIGDAAEPADALVAASPIAEVLVANISIGARFNRAASDNLLKTVRKRSYKKGNLVAAFKIKGDETQSIGKFYQTLAASDNGSSLFDRTQRLVETSGIEGNTLAIVNNIYPTVAAVDSVEEMIASLGVESVTEFDFQKFDQNHEAMSLALARYQAQPMGEAAATNLNAVNQALVAESYNVVAPNSDGNSLLSNLAKKFQERVEEIFEEMQLEGYSRMHPGMQHRCGVPENGTLVLLCTHVDAFRTVPNNSFNFSVADVFSPQNLARGNNLAALRTFRVPHRATPITNLRSPAAMQTIPNPLNDYIVLADFCIPTMCCDGDCSELLDVAEDPEPAVADSKVTVTVQFDDPRNRLMTLTRATLTVKDKATGRQITVISDANSHQFTAPASVYELKASARGFRSKTITLTLDGLPSVIKNIKLTPNRQRTLI